MSKPSPIWLITAASAFAALLFVFRPPSEIVSSALIVAGLCPPAVWLFWSAVNGRLWSSGYQRLNVATTGALLLGGMSLLLIAWFLVRWAQKGPPHEFLAVSGSVAIFFAFNLSIKLRIPHLRQRLKRAIRRGDHEHARRLALKLRETTLQARLVDDSRKQSLRFAKDCMLLGQQKEVFGDYGSAAFFYGWAAEAFLKAGMKRKETQTGQRLGRQLVRAVSAHARVTVFTNPAEADKLRAMVERVVARFPDAQATEEAVSIGARVVRVGTVGGESLERLYLRRRAAAVLRGEKMGFAECYAALQLARRLQQDGEHEDVRQVVDVLSSKLRSADDDRLFFVWTEVEQIRIDALDRDGKADQAYREMCHLIDRIKSRIRDFATQGSERALLTLSEVASGVVRRFVGLVLERFADSAEKKRAAVDVLIGLESVAAEVRFYMGRVLISQTATNYPEEQKQVVSLRSRLANVWREPKSARFMTRWLRLELEEAESFLIQTAYRDPSAMTWLDVDSTAVRGTLDADEVLIDLIAARLSSGEFVYVGFALSPTVKEPVRMLHLGATKAVDDSLDYWKEWMVALDEPPPGDSSSVPLADLVSKLVSAFGDAKRVVLVADGRLHELPFEAQRDESGVVLLDRFSWIYADAARVLMRRRTDTKRAPMSAIVVAAPEFDWPGGDTFSVGDGYRDARKDSIMTFEDLPGAREEGEKVCSIIGGRAFFGRDATVPNIRKNTAGPEVLHVATHAFAQPHQTSDESSEGAVEGSSFVERLEDPETRAGLALAGVNAAQRGCPESSEIEDGVLSALEASALDLDGTRLVVLSACDTGRGDLHQGEGTIGLRRALGTAGAESMVTTLWKARDKAAMTLIARFYDLLAEGSHISDALTEAKRELRREYPQPYYWAPYVVHEAGHAGKSLPLSRAGGNERQENNY